MRADVNSSSISIAGPPFAEAAGHARPKTPAPFCLRLSKEQREQLTTEAGGLPLGTYMRAKLLADSPMPRRRAGQSIEDRKALAQALALLGEKRYASNLNQLAHLGHIGALPFTPEIVTELDEA